MISDVLFDAREKIESYEAEFPQCYSGEIRGRIAAVKASMLDLQRVLDAPPGAEVVRNTVSLELVVSS